MDGTTPGSVPQLLVISSGCRPGLRYSAREIGMSLGHASVRLCQIQDSPGDISLYDGVIIGIEPDGTGATLRMFSFLRHHLESLAAVPVSFFFLLSRAPVLNIPKNMDPSPFFGLSRINPLDVQVFDAGAASPDRTVPRAVGQWACETVWPMMEALWQAGPASSGISE